jgi:hypothetical protein
MLENSRLAQRNRFAEGDEQLARVVDAQPLPA